MAARRISPGIYEVNGKRINAPTGAAAEAAYDKKYGAKAAKPPAAAPTGTPAAAPPPSNSVQNPDPNTGAVVPPPPAPGTATAANVNQSQTDIAANAGNAALSNLVSSTSNQQPQLSQAQLNAAAGITPASPAPAPASATAPDPAQAALADVGTGPTEQQYTGNAGAAQQLPGEVTNLNNAFNPVLTARQSSGDLSADRSRIEGDVYGRLTQGLEQDYQNARQQNEQTLRNKGIPFSADPRSRYQQELGALDRRFDNARLQARQTATQLGGEEFSRQFGIGETLRGNQLGEQSGIRNQRIGEQTALAGVGQPGFQAAQANATNQAQLANQLAIANLQARTSKDVARIQNKRRAVGGGAATNTNDPFPV